MGAEPGRRFLIQPAAKLEPELLQIKVFSLCKSDAYESINTFS